MTSTISRKDALELLMKYNKESFHIQHGLTVEKTMRWFARELGYGHKIDGRQYYHFVQSFDKQDDLSPQETHAGPVPAQ